MSLLTPIKYPVKQYSWNDPQAPLLTDDDGVIKTILKACLVTGYGNKVGAGWKIRFEDDSRLVLRRPLETGNPPDIKIENGQANGKSNHSIVFQDNPQSLEDDNFLAYLNIITRDETQGKWQLLATDFAFMLLYQMGGSGYNSVHNGYMSILYIGGATSLLPAHTEFFVGNGHNAYRESGRSGHGQYAILSNQSFWANVRAQGDVRIYPLFANIDLTEKEMGTHSAQPVFLSNIAKLPFYCSLATKDIPHDDVASYQTKVVMINNRPMMYYVDKKPYRGGLFPMYIPLDYWEL